MVRISRATAVTTRPTAPAPTLRVEAIGLFLATHDVPRLVAWYKALGLPVGDEGYCVVGGGEPGTGSVFSIMPAATPLPQTPAGRISEEPYGLRSVTLNLRVRDLDAVVEDLRGRGVDVAGPRDYGYARFAWVHDPDGNVVELWEPGRGEGMA